MKNNILFKQHIYSDSGRRASSKHIKKKTARVLNCVDLTNNKPSNQTEIISFIE
jgi:hypothetical protein